jgi:hypothetical protein
VVERRIVRRDDVVATMPAEWVCRPVLVRVAEPFSVCPRCQASAERFSLQDQSPVVKADDSERTRRSRCRIRS